MALQSTQPLKPMTRAWWHYVPLVLAGKARSRGIANTGEVPAE